VPFGEAFAILRVPRLGADYARPVLEGTTTEVLEGGVGHYRGTAAPGAVGNFAIAGHRTTYGRPFHDIDRLREGDVVAVETKTAYNVYRVKRHAVVAPSAVEVIAPVPGEPGRKPTARWLTMTACHPKYSAAQRYVVFAELEKTYARAEGLPIGTLAIPTGD
jgi:sortase A